MWKPKQSNRIGPGKITAVTRPQQACSQLQQLVLAQQLLPAGEEVMGRTEMTGLTVL